MVRFLGREAPWRRDRLPTPVFLGFPCGSADKESSCNTGDLGLIPGLGRAPGEGKDDPLHYSGLENSMDCIVHGVPKSWIQLSGLHFHHVYGLLPGALYFHKYCYLHLKISLGSRFPPPPHFHIRKLHFPLQVLPFFY